MGACSREPRPAAVCGNDWVGVALPDARSFVPSRPLSVIVPCFEQPEELALTVAGLERQCFPRELFEVVVVDDGSEPPIVPPPASTLELRIVRQQRRGFGLARARNAGAAAAASDVLVFLDGDVIPEAGLLAAHARWHETVSDALTLGFCRYVSVRGIGAGDIHTHPGDLAQLFRDRPSDPPWFERHMVRTAEMTAPREDLFRAVTGHNFAVGRAFFEEIGGFDESFSRYGGEDTEFGWRAQVRGGLLVPVREAAGWHQGRWNEGREAKRRSQALQVPELARRIPDPGFRFVNGPYAVPRYAISLDARGASAEQILAAVDALLADPAGDLAVLVDMEAERSADRAHIENRLGQEVRVRILPSASVPAASGLASWQVAAMDAYPASPYLLRAPVLASLDSTMPRRLQQALGATATGYVTLPAGYRVEIFRSVALARARRAGGVPADYGAELALPTTLLQPHERRRRMPVTAPHEPGALAAVVGRVRAEARHVRGVRTGWRFLKWFAGGVRWYLREGAGWRAAPMPVVPVHSDPPLGAEIATLGPRAAAVFAASSRSLHGPRSARAGVMLADTVACAIGVKAPLATLDSHPALAVPAFDPACDNPVGWVRDVEPHDAALGDPHRLPPDLRADRRVSEDDRHALQYCRRLVDATAFHGCAVQRAGTLARIAARGVPVRLADLDSALKPLLGTELYRLMLEDPPNAIGGATRARELLSVAMRREALRSHSLRARVRQVCAAAGTDEPALPLVSVTLATRRPDLLRTAVAGVAMQTYPRVELVLVLHGPGFAAEKVEAALADFRRPLKLLRLGSEMPLGAVLRAATAEAGGSLLAKMDDDDTYGPEHLWDLVLAREYSGAALVGKFPATVYLSRLDKTVRRREVPAEIFSRGINGGALLLGRADLARAGGWRPLPRHVDAALVEDVIRVGDTVYRTHDLGYLLVRRGAHHTWKADDECFLAAAETVLDGWCPQLAGIADAPPPLADAGGP